MHSIVSGKRILILILLLLGVGNNRAASQVPPALVNFLAQLTITVAAETDYFQWDKQADTTLFDVNYRDIPDNVSTNFNIHASYAPLPRLKISLEYKEKVRITYALFVNTTKPFNDFYTPGPSRATFINYGENPEVNSVPEIVPFTSHIGGSFHGHQWNILYNVKPWLGVMLDVKKMPNEQFDPDFEPADFNSHLPPYVYGSFQCSKYFLRMGPRLSPRFGKWQFEVQPEMGLSSQIKGPWNQAFKGHSYRLFGAIRYGPPRKNTPEGSWWQYSLGYFYEKQDFGQVSLDIYHGFTGGIYFNF